MPAHLLCTQGTHNPACYQLPSILLQPTIHHSNHAHYPAPPPRSIMFVEFREFCTHPERATKQVGEAGPVIALVECHAMVAGSIMAYAQPAGPPSLHCRRCCSLWAPTRSSSSSARCRRAWRGSARDAGERWKRRALCDCHSGWAAGALLLSRGAARSVHAGFYLTPAIPPPTRSMHPSVHRKLVRYFQEPNMRLYSLLGRSFGWEDPEGQRVSSYMTGGAAGAAPPKPAPIQLAALGSMGSGAEAAGGGGKASSRDSVIRMGASTVAPPLVDAV